MPKILAAAILMCPVLCLGEDIAWQKLTKTIGMPGYNGWLTWVYDSAAHEILHYGTTPGASTIYSTNVSRFHPATNRFTNIIGTGNKENACTADGEMLFGERHPAGQLAIDTKRNVLWIMGGVNSLCTQPSGPGSNPRQDMYTLSLDGAKVQRYFPAVWPRANAYGAMIYDSDHDILRLYGSDIAAQKHDNWIYCPNNSGSLIPKQIAAGCTAADNWIEVFPPVQPRAVWLSQMHYDRLTAKAYLFGGDSGARLPEKGVWTIDSSTGMWEQRSELPATETIMYYPQVAYKPSNGTFYYHQASGEGSPRDFLYVPGSNSWIPLKSTGGGPTAAGVAAYDEETNAVYVWTRNEETGAAVIWKGQLANPPTPEKMATDSR